jgi:hypothetical protein
VGALVLKSSRLVVFTGETAVAEGAVDAVTQQVDPLVKRAQTRVGSTLRGKWHPDVLLGVGGMAAVCRASRHGRRERSS